MGKPRNFGAGSQKTQKFGQGQFLQSVPGKTVPVLFNDFSGGFDSRVLREGVPNNASNDMLDMEVTRKNRLKRGFGTVGVETLAGHTASQFALHAALRGSAELVLFDPPFLGIKRVGDTVWTDYGIADSGQDFVWSVYGDDLIFTNGLDTVWGRHPQDAPFRIPGAPIASTYASFASRVYAGGAIIDGSYEPMGMQWSDARGDVKFWDILQGGGAELLIDETVPDDRIVANRTMGLGMMAILCRHSVWAATLTGDPFRPADFQPRVVGAGCVNEKTARATPIGCIYLSEDGLRVFDGNQSRILSDRINGELVPLDLANLPQYSAFYDPLTNRYKLLTPSGTWIYDIGVDRFYHSSLIASAGTIFADQLDGTTWAALNGTWADLQALQLRWRDLDTREQEFANTYYIATPPGLDTLLHKEDAASTTMFGAPIVPHWESKLVRGSEMNTLMTTKGVMLEYVGGGTLRFYVPDNKSEYVEILSQPLVPAAKQTTIWLPFVHTGLGAGLRIEIAAGATLEIVQMALDMMERGPRLETQPFFPREYFPDFNA